MSQDPVVEGLTELGTSVYKMLTEKGEFDLEKRVLISIINYNMKLNTMVEDSEAISEMNELFVSNKIAKIMATLAKAQEVAKGSTAKLEVTDFKSIEGTVHEFLTEAFIYLLGTCASIGLDINKCFPLKYKDIKGE